MKILADTLDYLQASKNNSRGVSCVRSIVNYLREGDLTSAKTVWRTDGDKIRQYKDIEAQLIGALGCRLHGADSCRHCKDLA